MNKKILALLLACCMTITGMPIATALTTSSREVEIINMTAEYLTKPIGIEADSVHLGWQMKSDRVGAKQTAYQVVVTDEQGNIAWDSGKTESSLSTGIVCKSLKEQTIYDWQVTVWDEMGAFYTEKSTFETGVTNTPEWKNAEFIRMNASSSAPIFRTEQSLYGNKIKKARLYITSLGVYQAYVNGNRVGEYDENGNVVYHHMNPGYGNGNVSLGYQTYDVTEFIKSFDSVALSVMAGTGWYNGMWNTNSQPAIKAMLSIDYADGSKQTIVTDTKNWKGTLQGGITASGIYYGEDYDARLAHKLGDFTQVGYDDSAWVIGAKDENPAEVIPHIENTFSAQKAYFVRIKVLETGPAIKDDSENFLQLTEIEILDKNGNNVASGIVPIVSDTWSPNEQWSPNHLTDGDLGKESDYGYTSTLLSNEGKTSVTLQNPITISFAFENEMEFNSLRMYPRTSKNSVVENECANYPKKYVVEISNDGENWNTVDEFTVDSLQNAKNSNTYLSSTTYDGIIKAQPGTQGKLISNYDKNPVSATLYTKEKLISKYDGGEIKVDNFYAGQKLSMELENGLTLQKGQKVIFDMSQNMTAVPMITFSGKSGVKATLRFAEILNDGSKVGDKDTEADGPKGSIYQKNLRNARSQATYIFSGKDIETYQTQLSFFGYKYVEVTATDDITIYDIKSKAISSVFKETGHIETNNANVNKLLSNIKYGQLSNYFTAPTDCNQRDERLSWTGDTQAFAQTAVYNFDSVAFLRDVLNIYKENAEIKGYVPAVTDDLNGYFSNWAAGWSDALVILPWVLYLQTGDKSILQENWDILEKYMDYLHNNERGEHQAPTPNNERNFGDWLSFQGTSVELINDCYYGYVHSLMAKIASVLGKAEEQAEYSAKFENIKEKFIKTHIEFENGVLTVKSSVGNPLLQFQHGSGKEGVLEDNSQTSLLWILKLGFYNSDEMKEAAEKLLIENIENKSPSNDSMRKNQGEKTLATGFLGSNIITPVLTDIGNSSLSYDLLLQDEQPSWLFEVMAGATTVWERWNSYTPGVGFGSSEMNSFNHYAYGSVAEWMYQYMAGIKQDENQPGFKNIILQPTLDVGEKYNSQARISAVSAYYDTYYGRVYSVWKADNGNLNSYYTNVPANTTATLYLPVDNSMTDFTEIDGVKFVEMIEHNDCKVAKFELQSGEYSFKVENGKLSVKYGNECYFDNIQTDTFTCSCDCHKTGIEKFFWEIGNFFHKIFDTEKYQACECGQKHW